MSAADGSVVWRKNIGGVVDTITVVDGTLFATTTGSVVHALDAATGAERWQATPPAGDLTGGAIPAVVQDGPVIVGATDSSDGAWLFAFDRSTGAESWRVDTGAAGSGFLSPIVTGGRVVVGLKDSESDRLVSFGTP